MNILCISEALSSGDQASSLEGASVTHTTSAQAAIAMLNASSFDGVVVAPVKLDHAAIETVEEVRRAHGRVPVVALTSRDDAAAGFDLAQAGATAVLPADASGRDIADAIALSRPVAPEARAEPAWRRLLVGSSPAMQTVAEVIRLVGPRRCTVLITGETGTGKEIVARAIHMAGSRSSLPMVAVNCAALPDQLLEAELFGHVRGAFTGAANARVGRFEQANRSTLFLDEIGDMPFDLQSKLLRVIQEREIQRLGSSDNIHLDVRFIAASNVDLEQAIEDGTFRQDLYYRLNVVPIRLPALRERMADIPVLANHFMDKVCRADDLPSKRLSPQAIDLLTEYDWPGNVRQLENAIETAVILSGERSLLSPADFRLPVQGRKRPACSTVPCVAVPDHGLDFERTVGRIERDILEQALNKTNGNKKRAAEMLRLKRTTLAAKLKSLEALAC